MKQIYLYEHFTSKDPIFVGTIFVEEIRGKEMYSFEYDEEYLKHPSIRLTFDPNISLYKGRQYPSKNNFAFLNDLMPDRWGKLLIDHNIKLENKDNKTASLDSTYLLSINDISRMGGFRLSLDKKTFVSDDPEHSIPPYLYLNKLEQASIEFSKDNNIQKWIKELFYAGSSLGGARPKANIYDNDNNLYIAKFPSINDEYDIEALEAICYELASLSNINVSEFKVETLSKHGTTLLIKRFDRNIEKRIHYVTAMTLLNKDDGEHASYLDIVSIIKSYSNNVNDELKELYRRIVFYIIINNTDNHLRNISFILKEKGLSLTPIYDINPNIYKSIFATSFNNNGYDNLNDAINNAIFFNISSNEANKIINNIIDIVKNNYFKLCKKYKVNNKLSNDIYKSFNLEVK